MLRVARITKIKIHKKNPTYEQGRGLSTDCLNSSELFLPFFESLPLMHFTRHLNSNV